LKPKDRDFLETEENLLFCVVGYLHHPERVTAYLKYVPSKHGKWRRGDTQYTRTLTHYNVTQVENTYTFLADKYPDYLYDCPVRNITISSVPKTSIKTYFTPQIRVEKLLREGAHDPLEQKLVDLVNLLRDTTGTDISFGATGSILTSSHNPTFSDIDLTVYGYIDSMRVKESLTQLMENKKRVQPLSIEKREEWLMNQTQRFPLNREELEKVYSRRWNYGHFDGTYFSIHPTRKNEEITEEYSEYIYLQMGNIQGTATIKNTTESSFLPAIYEVECSEPRTKYPEISWIVSYEGLYGNLFDIGDRIIFKGNLEHVTGKRDFHQVVIGGAGSKNSFVKWT
jgi:predicted nucleotidyltransferase